MHHHVFRLDHVDPNIERQRHPDLVFLDMCVQSRVLILLQDVLGGLAILG